MDKVGIGLVSSRFLYNYPKYVLGPTLGSWTLNHFHSSVLPIVNSIYYKEKGSSVFWYGRGKRAAIWDLNKATVISIERFKGDLDNSNSLCIYFLQIYPIKERKDRTRLALIICNTEFDHLPLRKGSELDVTGMKLLLEGLGYSVDVKEKLTATVRAPHPLKTCMHSTHILLLIC